MVQAFSSNNVRFNLENAGPNGPYTITLSQNIKELFNRNFLLQNLYS